MDEKDIQYLSLLVMQLHLNIGRMERLNGELQAQVDKLKQQKKNKQDPVKED